MRTFSPVVRFSTSARLEGVQKRPERFFLIVVASILICLLVFLVLFDQVFHFWNQNLFTLAHKRKKFWQSRRLYNQEGVFFKPLFSLSFISGFEHFIDFRTKFLSEFSNYLHSDWCQFLILVDILHNLLWRRFHINLLSDLSSQTFVALLQ